MANLSIACCHTVNGVSRVHLELLKMRVFKVIILVNLFFYFFWLTLWHFWKGDYLGIQGDYLVWSSN